MLKKFLKNQKGLTLVELLAVVVILGIVSSIAVVSIGNVIERSREDAIHADAIRIINAAEIYVAQGGIIEGSIDEGDLEDFLASTGSFDEFTITGEAGDLRFTGTGVNGSVTIEFTGASLEQINQSRENRVDTNGVIESTPARTAPAGS